MQLTEQSPTSSGPAGFTSQRVVMAVANLTGEPVAKLTNGRRPTRIVGRRRQMAVYVIRKHLGLTQRQTADEIGWRDTTSVHYAEREVAKRLAEGDEETTALYDRVLNTLRIARVE